MTLKLHALEAIYIVCILGSGIPSGRYLSSCDTVNYHVLGHTLVPDLASNIYSSCHVFVNMANLATKPPSSDDGLVARLYILKCISFYVDKYETTPNSDRVILKSS